MPMYRHSHAQGRQKLKRLALPVVLAALPLMTPVKVILFLRVLAGIFSAVGGPAAVALAVESSSSMSRVNIMFALSFLHSLGYLCEAFGVLFFMPQMGEGPHDSWRSLSVFISLPSVVCVPLVCILRESPSLLAVKGRVAECIEALETIAIWNGQPTLSMVGVSPQFSEAPSSSSDGMLLFDTLSCMLKSYMHLVVLLTIVDSSRSFFMSGSAYLCKDLIMLSHSNVAPSIMNLVVNATPLIGVMLGSRFAFLGVRRINFMFSTLAAFAFLVLSSATMRQHPFILLTSMLVFKLSYGPISTCVSLMIIEAFPTEIRTTAYSVVAIVGKLLCMLGPILVESLKEGERADSWPDNLLRLYLMALAFAALSSGCLSLLLPAKVGNGRKLQDYVITRNGQIINMLDEDDMFFLLKDDRYRSKGQRRISTYGATLQDTVARGLAALAIKEGSYEASGSSSSCDEST
eukprot:TRINITY_DN8589_c1_g5_i1.p1 TRINITY_DN8589_c1_g5~~TRINITY_DN8589_c1_g5_i1.p1  ORF type:complete len:461 (-),score=48.30 TRINITY_DN8589_c1_g5_i1:150-1532(-)